MSNSTESTPPIDVEQHPLHRSIILHLFPGIVIGVVFFATVGLVQAWGFPSYMALLLAIPLALVPAQLGYLLYLGKKRNGRFSLEGVVVYRERIPIWQYFVFAPLLFLALVAIFKLASPIDVVLLKSLFAWLPESVIPEIHPEAHSRSVLIITYLALIIFGAFIAPVVEEMYFRGYLLPRLSRFKAWAPVINCVLFALYHVWTPWRAASRALFFLPVAYAVQYKKNIYLGMVVHVLANGTDAVIGVMFLLGLSTLVA